MKSALDIAIVILTVSMMFSVGLELEASQFKDLAHDKAAFLGALVGQMVVLPAIGIFVVRAIPLPESLQMGILLLAACPVGDVANFYALIARGDPALSVVVNSASSLLSCFTMPVVFGIYSKAMGADFPFSVPALTLVGRLIVLVVIPIAGGMGLRAFRTSLADKFSQQLRIACVAGILVLCSIMIASRHEQLRLNWKVVFFASASLILMAIVAGLAIGRLLRLKRPEVITLAILLPVRNVGLAVTIAVTLMDRLEYVVLATVYFLTETFLLLGSAALFRYLRVGTPGSVPLGDA
jgi:bile acid:Na+ symporter, BASS family